MNNYLASVDWSKVISTFVGCLIFSVLAGLIAYAFNANFWHILTCFALAEAVVSGIDARLHWPVNEKKDS